MRFDGSSGKKPSAEARRYVYKTIAHFLTDDVDNAGGGWLLSGIDDEVDRRRIRKAAQAVAVMMRRKANT